jgi:cytochrome c-type biogenesis protein CcmH
MWWMAAAWATDPAVVVSGTITVDPARAAEVSKATALFVSVKDPAGGPPLAALKLAPGPFPLAFLVSEANAIPMGGAPRPIPAAVNVTLRLDGDGDPLTKEGLPEVVLTGTKTGSTGMTVVLK